ncbi:MAG TPA: LutB/LldF family L-lactate oxidation iron-sulfur protein [Pyrinomonadaceae bacterium]
MNRDETDLTTRSHAALGDPVLQTALGNATATFIERRRESVSAVPDWQALRERARRVKEHTINHLDYYLERLVEKVTEHGGKVYWASTGEDVSRYVVSLARARGVTTVVKGKSMTTEEIELNHALEAEGIRPVETDLGEYIIQLARERPSHIIVPAIHKTRGQIADLFAEKLRAGRLTEVAEITAVARERLRADFLSAGMGVTGANFAVAETGTIVLVENEGNIRLSTQVPPVHVAVVGIEKVIPSFEDLSVFLRLLPRSGTGQKQTAYVSFLNGPRHAPSAAGGGTNGAPATEFHLVLLDNGRTRILADEQMRESLYCIRCGACLNVCPVYQKIGGQAYGWIYPGPIGAVISPQLQGLKHSGELPFASSLCGACREACPVAINLPDLLLALRAKAKEEGGAGGPGAKSFSERVSMRAYAAVAKRPRLFAAAGRLMRGLARLAEKGGRIRSVPLGPLGDWTKYRDLPAPPRGGSFRERWRKGGGQE